jgi:hypothetical protein
MDLQSTEFDRFELGDKGRFVNTVWLRVARMMPTTAVPAKPTKSASPVGQLRMAYQPLKNANAVAIAKARIMTRPSSPPVVAASI